MIGTRPGFFPVVGSSLVGIVSLSAVTGLFRAAGEFGAQGTPPLSILSVTSLSLEWILF